MLLCPKTAPSAGGKAAQSRVGHFPSFTQLAVLGPGFGWPFGLPGYTAVFPHTSYRDKDGAKIKSDFPELKQQGSSRTGK